MATSVQFRTLLQPPDPKQSQDRALATLRNDFGSKSLDDAALAELLAAALQSHAEQHRTLERQAEASTRALPDVLKNARARLTAVSSRARKLHEDHLQLEDELIDFREALLPSSSSATLNGDDPSSAALAPSPTLLQTLESQQAHLDSIRAARDWFASLQRVEAECLVVRRQADGRRWEEAIESWKRLVHMSDATGVDQVVVGITRSVAKATWHYLDTAVSRLTGEALDLVQWPHPVEQRLEPYRPQGAAIQQAITVGLKLQRAGESFQSKVVATGETFPPEGLVPIRAIVQPLVLRFRYHFDGERQTNRLDKPEWYFTHVANLLRDHERFIRQDVQSMLAPGGYLRTDAMAQVSRLLVAQVERKLRNTAPQLVAMPPVLAHTIYQALDFDATLRDRNQAPSSDWKGSADVILGNEGWFDAWVEAEKQFVDSKYYEIIGSPDAWQLVADYTPDVDDLSSLTPTNSALHVRDLFLQTTERYRPLPLFSHRAPFLLLIQIPLLEAYLSRITSSIDAFESLSFGLMRAVPGSIGEGVGAKVTSGVAGAQRLLKAGLSARWMAGVCSEWEDDVTYLELFDDLQTETLPKTDLRTAAADLVATAKVASAEDPTLFRSFAKQFEELSGRSEAMLVKHVVREVTNELKPYVSQRWNLDPRDDSSAPMELSPLAVPAISMWTALVRTLHSTLPTPRASPLFRQAAAEVQDFLVGRIVLSRSMTAISLEGGRQFSFDAAYGWVGALRSGDGGEGEVRRPETALRRLLDVGVLLALPTEPAAGEQDLLTFSRAMQAAFSDDEPAFRRTMDEVGVRSLARSEVQAVLRRRPECWR